MSNKLYLRDLTVAGASKIKIIIVRIDSKYFRMTLCPKNNSDNGEEKRNIVDMDCFSE
jgi:hypothetical protein